MINGTSGGDDLVFHARLDGSRVTQIGSAQPKQSSAVPPSARNQLDRAQRQLDCVQRAQTIEELTKCAQAP